MKKMFIAPLVLLMLAACGGESGEKKATDVNDITANPDYQKGVKLVANNGCLTCHQIDAPLTGPPYREVAKRYASSPDTIVNYLAHKIITGGSGNWGQVPMIPHPTLSVDDAKTIVRYILLLKK